MINGSITDTVLISGPRTVSAYTLMIH